jgi:hypothetical protein
LGEVDRKGVRSAYDLWLSRNIQHAELLRAEEPARRGGLREIFRGRINRGQSPICF